MNKKRKRVLIIAGVIFIFLLVLSTRFFNQEEVEAIILERGTIQRSVDEIGHVQVSRIMELQIESSARVKNVTKTAGDFVEAGEEILILESIDLELLKNETQLRLSQAESQLLLAVKNYEQSKLAYQEADNNLQRYGELFKAGAISQSEEEEIRRLHSLSEIELDAAEKNLNTSQAQLSRLQKLLESVTKKEQELIIQSPFAGVLLSLEVREGQLVNPGMLLGTVGDTDDLEIKAYLLSDDLAEVAQGQKVLVRAGVLGDNTVEGKLIKIYPRAEEIVSALGVIQRRVPVLVRINNASSLQPGYEARIAILTFKKENVLILPREAVRTVSGGEREVLRIKNGKLEIKTVITGERDRDNVEIISGIEEGDILLRDAGKAMSGSRRIKPIIK